MFWKQMPKEKLTEMLKDPNIGDRTKYRICEFLGIKKKESELSGKIVLKSEKPNPKPKKDPYEYSTGKWV